MRRMLGLVLLTGLLTFVGPDAPVRACLWDSDTLAQEARAFPDLPSVITGRFARNPPLYYEMRLRRAAAAVRDNPNDFAAYDDAGVSCDRLRRGDAAIAWMEKKRARLSTKDRRDATVCGHWYRYHANVGTFWAHRWLRAGANRARLTEMRTGRAHIAAALALNADAHFGREKYQLAVMDWIITGGGPKRQSLGDYLFHPNFHPDAPRAAEDAMDETVGGVDETVRGLSGLIVLGDAWESVDVFAALAYALGRRRDASLSEFARLRGVELINAGNRSLLPGASPETLKRELRLDARAWYGLLESNRAHVGRVYRTARRAADAWEERRTAYLSERLRAGRHPDTDPTFWQDWREPAPARLTGSWLWEQSSLLRTPAGRGIIAFWVAVAAIGLACFVVVLRWVRRRVRIQRRSRAAAGMSRPE